MSAIRFRFTFRDGCSVSGHVQGSGGFVSSLERLRLAQRRVLDGQPHGLYAPRPDSTGCIVCFPDFSAESDGLPYVVDLREVATIDTIGTHPA
jgi:hypothetical protein